MENIKLGHNFFEKFTIDNSPFDLQKEDKVEEDVLLINDVSSNKLDTFALSLLLIIFATVPGQPFPIKHQ